MVVVLPTSPIVFSENAKVVPEEPGTSTSNNGTESTVVKIASNPHTLLVNPKQKGNPILRSIKNVPWEYDDIVPDYQMGRTVCALFLSLRYHNLNPDYIHERLKQLGKMYELRVLLVQVTETFLFVNTLTSN